MSVFIYHLYLARPLCNSFQSLDVVISISDTQNFFLVSITAFSIGFVLTSASVQCSSVCLSLASTTYLMCAALTSSLLINNMYILSTSLLLNVFKFQMCLQRIYFYASILSKPYFLIKYWYRKHYSNSNKKKCYQFCPDVHWIRLVVWCRINIIRI